MPDKRRHRGPDPEDEVLFAAEAWPQLRQAAGDLCWLLNRGYAIASALELVGNRYELVRRQRIAVGRCVCTDAALQLRQCRQLDPSQVNGREIWLDGYNVITVLEAALAGGVVLSGRDGCRRDIAGIHGSYRTVEETLPALRLVGEITSHWGVSGCRWWLDRPVSNSGRLKHLLEEIAASAGWRWEVALVYNPDKVLSETEAVVATSDSIILDRCAHWINLAKLIIDQRIVAARIVDLSLSHE